MANSNDDRSDGLRQTLTSLGQVQDSTIRVGSTVIAGTSIPNLGIWQYQSYQVQSIYDQVTNRTSGVVEKVVLETLADNSNSNYNNSETATTSTRYVTLFSDKYHQEIGPVVVQPEEAQLSSMQEEVVDSVLWALPLFGFWTALAWSFANQYNQRSGGDASFLDAMLGR